MSIEGQIQGLEQKVKTLIESEPEVFLVEIRIKPTNNVKVFLDADKGMSLDKLIQYNRKLYRDLEESSFFPGGDFSLEVSSPGLDEPLKLKRQYQKNIGRSIEVLRVDGVKNEGKLLTVSDDEIGLEEEKGKGKKKELVQHSDDEIVLEEEKGKGKKKELVQHTIPFSEIKATWIQIKF